MELELDSILVGPFQCREFHGSCPCPVVEMLLLCSLSGKVSPHSPQEGVLLGEDRAPYASYQRQCLDLVARGAAVHGDSETTQQSTANMEALKGLGWKGS